MYSNFWFIEKHIDKVNWNYLSGNSNLPLKFFEKHLEKVDWEYLSGNPSIVEDLIIKPAKR